MNRKLIIGARVCIILLLLVFLTPRWLKRRKRLQANQLPEAAYQAIISDPNLTLISLDPSLLVWPAVEPPPGPRFHDFRVIGATTVSDASSRQRLADTLRNGLDSWNERYAACFSPHHGIHAVHSGKAYEFVVCFDCGRLQFYPPAGVPGNSLYGFGPDTTAGPFAEILTAANVPVVK